MTDQSKTTAPAHPTGPRPDRESTPKNSSPARAGRGSSLDRILARIDDERTRQYVKSRTSIYGIFAMAIADEMDSMWDAVGAEPNATPERSGALRQPEPAPSHIVPPEREKTPDITDAEAAAIRSFLAEHFSTPDQGNGRLTSQVILTLSALAERLQAMESFVEVALNRLDSVFSGDESMAGNLDHQNACSALVGFVQTRGQLHTASDRIPRSVKRRPD